MKSLFFGELWKIRVELSVIILAVVTILAFVPVFTYLVFVRDLQSKDTIMNRNNTGLILTDRYDKPFFTFYSVRHKEFIPLAQIPLHLQHAVIASEDKDFYQHPGFSISGMVRSLILDIQKRDTAYGGSTITQQLVKNSLLNSKRDFLRKYQEVVLAQEIERRYRKPEILEMYLNSVYFGEGAFGIQQAAKTYFDKSASDLTLAQSVLLVGILPAPSRYSPISGNETLGKDRQAYVLQRMREQGYISQTEKAAAEKTKLIYTRARTDINFVGTHFALMVRDQLVKQYGEEYISRSGLRVRTALDLDWQEYAEKVVADQVARLAPNNVSNGSAVVIAPKTGEIRVLVGSKDWFDDKFGKVNVATSVRSPGSSFKPIIYAAALEKHLITPATSLRDEQTTFPGNYRPKDYDGKFRGIVLARRALANSLNIPSVAVMEKVGVPDGLAMGQRLGLTTLKDPSQYGLSLVLGTAEVKLLELTNVYATFANAGIKNDITTILAITDKSNKTIYRVTPNPEHVLDKEVAFLISSILSDSHARAEVFGNALTVSRPAAVKTGTAEDYRDALTLGYTPSIAVGVWVGNNDDAPMDQIAGSLGAAPIWRSLIERFTAGTPIEQFTPPQGVIAQNVCGRTEYFLPGTAPTYCPLPKPTQPIQLAIPSGPVVPFGASKKELREEFKKERKNRGGPPPEQIEQVQQQVQEQIQLHMQQMQQDLQQRVQASGGAE